MERIKSRDKHPSFIVKEEDPYNGEPSLKLLAESFITPRELFFARSHGSTPSIDASTYRLSVKGMVDKSLTLSLESLRSDFPKQTRAATLQCAGNRRRELDSVERIEDELLWDAGAIGTAVWGGTPLRDVLRVAGVRSGAAHVDFVGLDQVQKEGRKFGFGGSIPLEKAESPEVLLAYEMNGEPLAPEHGFPLRVVVPGYVGARSVKWLGEIRVQTVPSDNYFYTRSYQLFPPQVTADRVDWSIGIRLGEVPVNSVICHPQEGERLPAGPVEVRGYAVGTAGRIIERVDISLDGGETWTQGSLMEAEEKGPWTWQFWRTTLDLPPGPAEIVVRAWDSAVNTQPEETRRIWNVKGYMNNAWHRVRIVVGG